MRNLLSLALTFLLALPLGAGCGSSSGSAADGGGQSTDAGSTPADDTSSAAAETSTPGADVPTTPGEDTPGVPPGPVDCWIVSPAADTVYSADVVVEIGFSGPVEVVWLLVNGARATSTVPAAGSTTATLTWTPVVEGRYELKAQVAGAGGQEMTSAAGVPIVVDLTAPKVVIDLPRFSVVSGDVTVPLLIDEPNVTSVRLLDEDDAELAAGGAGTTDFVWSTTAEDDGLRWLRAEVRDAAGNVTTCEPWPVAVVNNGEEVPVEYIPTAEVYVPANYMSTEYHTRVMTPTKLDVKRVVSWLVWDASQDWLLEYSLGQGFCPHRGIQYLLAESDTGVIVLDLARTDLPRSIVHELPADAQDSDVFPIDDDPATFGSFFGHVSPLEPADHVEQTLPIEIHYLLFY